MDETAMSSAEVAGVMAENKTIETAAAPDLLNNAAAAGRAGKPALTSLGRRTHILSGSSRSATVARPRVVENMNGTANLLPNGNFA